MASTPYARLLLSVEGGAAQAGGVEVTAEDSIAFVYESTAGWPSTPAPYLEVYEYPEGWAPDPLTGWASTSVEQPSGATATTYRYYGTTPPPAIAAPDLAHWGKVKAQLVVGGGKKAGVLSADMVSQAAFLVRSSEGLEGPAYREGTEFGDWRAWTAGIKRDLVLINDALASGGAGVTSVNAGQGITIADPAVPVVVAPRLANVSGAVATSGAVRIASGEAVTGRNAGGSANVAVAGLATDDTVELGDNSAAAGIVSRAKTGGLWKWFVNSIEGLRLSATSILFGETIAGTIGQVTRTTDAAPNDLTISPQGGYASATGANRKPGDLILDIPAPTNSGTDRGSIRIRHAGSDTFTFSKPETYYSEFRNYLSGFLIRPNDMSGGTCEIWFPGVTISTSTLGLRDLGQATRVSLALGSTVEWRMGDTTTVWRKTWIRDGSGNAMLYTDEATKAFTSDTSVGYETAYTYSIPDNCVAVITVRATCQKTSDGTASSFHKEITVSRFGGSNNTSVGSVLSIRADQQGDVTHLCRVTVGTTTVTVEVDSGTAAAKWGIHFAAQITKTSA